MKMLLTALLSGASIVAGVGQDLRPTIKEEAQKCANALMVKDYDAVVRYTHPRIVKAAGGKQAIISLVTNALAQMRAGGAEFSDATIGQPAAPKKIGEWLTSMVPQHVVLKVSGGKLHRDSTLLGISEDEGKHWVFVDLSTSKEEFKRIFPELDGKITLPEKKPPEFKRDQGV